jgi:hypothetical protein
MGNNRGVLDSILIERPGIFERPQHRRLDSGYAGERALEIVVVWGFIPHIKSRGQEKAEKAHNPAYRARRWVVELSHSWMNRFRTLLVRLRYGRQVLCVGSLKARGFEAQGAWAISISIKNAERSCQVSYGGIHAADAIVCGRWSGNTRPCMIR